MYRLIALLDNPSAQSFGMVPILVRKEGETHLRAYYGAADKPPNLHDDAEYRGMIHHSRNMEAFEIDLSEEPVGMIAGWLGKEFLARCVALDLPVLGHVMDMHAARDPNDPSVIEGVFWIGPTAEVYGQLESWLLAAAPRAFREKNPEIARLMAWCLPGREETWAAQWFTEKSEDGKQDRLKRILRLYRRRIEQKTIAALAARLESVIKRTLCTSP